MTGIRGSRLASLASGWIAPIGDWRSQLLWRGFGVAAHQLGVMLLGTPQLRSEPAFLASYAAAVLLIALGPRRILLAFSCVAQTGLLFHILGSPSYQLAEEYLPLAVLPAMGLLLCAAPIVGSSDLRGSRVDACQVALFRVAVLTLMAFAAFHKLNADFFDPTLSCAMIIPHRLLPYLPAADLIVRAMPYLGFWSEALVPLTLLLYPRLGMALTVVVMGTIGHRGATAFTSLVLLSAISFLRASDLEPLRAFWRRYGRWMAGGSLAVALTSFAVYQRFGTHRPWHEFLLFELILIAVTGCVLPLLYREARETWAGLRGGRGDDDRRSGLAQALRPAFLDQPILGFGRGSDAGIGPRSRLLLVLFIGVAVFNGMTPYLGLKFRLSFAMFSNLRVDDARWNHFWIPRSFDQRRYDPYVHVRRVGGPGASLLPPALYLPENLAGELWQLRKLYKDTDLEFAYQGEHYHYPHAQVDPDLLAWLVERSGKERWFHGYLTAETPQSCMH